MIKWNWFFCCYLDSLCFETWFSIILCHFKHLNGWVLKVLTKFVSFVSPILLLFVLDFGSKYILHYYHPWILYTSHPNFRYMFFGELESLKTLILHLLLEISCLSMFSLLKCQNTWVKKNAWKGKNMKFIEPFKMFDLLSFCKLN